MAKTISTIVENVPENIFLIGRYDDYKRRYKGNYLKCCDIIRPYKKVNLFDDEGEMSVQYYTEDEWNDTYEVFSDSRMKGHVYAPGNIDHCVFLRYLNSLLGIATLSEVIDDIMDGDAPFDFNELTPRSQELIKYVQNWDGKTPFDFCNNIGQSKQEEDDGNTYYYVKFFKL